MSESITWGRDSASATQVAEHLLACDTSFTPPLSQRVDVAAYAEKIVTHAAQFEAWEEGVLVGFAAMYCNRPPEAFLTTISVLPTHQNRKLGEHLLHQCLAHAAKLAMTTLALEVDSTNLRALAFYQKHGFTVVAEGATKRLQRTF